MSSPNEISSNVFVIVGVASRSAGPAAAASKQLREDFNINMECSKHSIEKTLGFWQLAIINLILN